MGHQQRELSQISVASWVRIYQDNVLRTQVKQDYPNAVEWQLKGLPEKYFPLIAPNRSAFVQKGKIIVGHGGISLEETIVPFITIRGELW